ncbi:MAG: gamma-glutamyl-gamma-aminobutyrate hydrolase family protein [Chloroflexi bacterium]|nr:gamma-glutamyl-gamma-aminobutyrate hydrolase family protein [Chloroflexota bacterium]
MPDKPLIGISVHMRSLYNSERTIMALRPTYTHAVTKAGGVPLMIPSQPDEVALRATFDALDALVISGGGDVDPGLYGATERSPYLMGVDRERDEMEIKLVRWAIDEDKPLLCICRGIQVLNVALGGTLIQDVRQDVEGALRHDAPSDAWFDRLVHDITVSTDSRLQEALGNPGETLHVNSLHHQALDRVADGLTVSSLAEDGIVEGVEIPDKTFMIGVQWHPEALVDSEPPMYQLFSTLIDRSR